MPGIKPELQRTKFILTTVDEVTKSASTVSLHLVNNFLCLRTLFSFVLLSNTLYPQFYFWFCIYCHRHLQSSSPHTGVFLGFSCEQSYVLSSTSSHSNDAFCLCRNHLHCQTYHEPSHRLYDSWTTP